VGGGAREQADIRFRELAVLNERIRRLEELLGAFIAAASGASVVDARFDCQAVSHTRWDGPPLSELTRRELQILELMAQGENNAGIAATLHLTEHSVEKYVSAVLAKLDLGSRTDVHRRVKAVLVYLSARYEARPVPPAPPGHPGSVYALPPALQGG
jgi:DNA-binding NarL/FixJ family response regulator